VDALAGLLVGGLVTAVVGRMNPVKR
jgi:hypothetical protein